MKTRSTSIACYAMVILVSYSLVLAKSRQASAFFEQGGCPLRGVASGARELQNVSNKTIRSYTLSCFKGKKRMSGIVEGNEDGIEAGGFASEGGFDLTPFNVCDSIGGKLGVYQVRFEDGSFWQSSAKETKASPGAMKP